MKSMDSLMTLKEQVSEETFQDILQVTEGLLVNDGRGDLFDTFGLNKTLSKYAKKYSKKAINYIGGKIKGKILKSNLVKNTIGKKEYENASKDLSSMQAKYDRAKQSHKNCTNDSQKRVHKEEMKHYNKEANKRAKRVSEIKQKYGL